MTETGQPMPIVVPARSEHIVGVARLHEQFIADQATLDFLVSGKAFLHDYYNDLITRDDCALFVAVAGAQVVGYVSLVADQSRVLLGLLRRHPGLLMHAALRPRFWRHLIRYVIAKLSLEFLGHKWAEVGGIEDLDAYHQAVELRSVAVDQAWRGHAVGVALMERAQHQAVTCGWLPLIAWVAESNAASNRLFQHAGFRLITQRGHPAETVNLYAWDRIPALGPLMTRQLRIANYDPNC